MITNIKLMVTFSKLSKTFMHYLGSNLEELGMSMSVYTILAHLHNVGQSKTQELGRVATITSGTITHTVTKLVKMDYVVKVQDETDKRVFWVEITDKGREEFLKVHEKHMQYLEYLLEDFSEEEKLAFTEQIKLFGKTIEQKGGQK